MAFAGRPAQLGSVHAHSGSAVSQHALGWDSRQSTLHWGGTAVSQHICTGVGQALYCQHCIWTGQPSINTALLWDSLCQHCTGVGQLSINIALGWDSLCQHCTRAGHPSINIALGWDSLCQHCTGAGQPSVNIALRRDSRQSTLH